MDTRKETPPDAPLDPTSLESSKTENHHLSPIHSVTDNLLQQYQTLRQTIQEIQGDDQNKQLALTQIDGMIIGVQAVHTFSSSECCHSSIATYSPTINVTGQERSKTYVTPGKRRSRSAPSKQTQNRFNLQKNFHKEFGQVEYNNDFQFNLETDEQRYRTEEIPILQFQRDLEVILNSICNQFMIFLYSTLDGLNSFKVRFVD